MNDDLVFLKGDWIACEDGHKNLVALRDIKQGEILAPAQFAFSDGTHPVDGEALPTCRECGRHLFSTKAGEGVVVRHILRHGDVTPYSPRTAELRGEE